MVYEHRRERLLPRRRFIRRVFVHFGVASAAIAFALAIGVVGYHVFGHLPWVDSVLNAAMILGGMGPVDALTSTPAKLFASAYALFAGLVFIGIVGLLLAPFAHRLMHRLHMEDSEADRT